jgi:hypothetical protein
MPSGLAFESGIPLRFGEFKGGRNPALEANV